MLGVQLLGNEQVTVKEYPEPTFTYKNDLLIQVKASGICGSEMHGYRSPAPHHPTADMKSQGKSSMREVQQNSRLGIVVGVHAVRGCGEWSVVFRWKIYLLP